MAESESDFSMTTDTQYLALTGELWGVYCEDWKKNVMKALRCIFFAATTEPKCYWKDYWSNNKIWLTHCPLGMPYGTIDIFITVCLLTHWGWVTHICLDNITIIGSDNGLSPGLHQAIIWTNAGILLIRPLVTNFSKILIGNQTFSFKKIHLKM